MIALVAFAANSVLCRLALDIYQMDPASFTVVRLLSGALVLFAIIHIRNPHKTIKSTPSSDWISALMLFIYAATFSFAYVTLDTATGALILFASVQISIVGYSIFSHGNLNKVEWLGLTLAFSGFLYLIYPDISSPSSTGFLLMSIAGMAWAVYTVRGKGSKKPLFDTAQNFIHTLPFILLLGLIMLPQAQLNTQNILLAILSGGIASGLGYAIWYQALAGLTHTQASVIQLSVPVIAALGGIVFVFEGITGHFMVSSTLILAGILIVIRGR